MFCIAVLCCFDVFVIFYCLCVGSVCCVLFRADASGFVLCIVMCYNVWGACWCLFSRLRCQPAFCVRESVGVPVCLCVVLVWQVVFVCVLA